MVKLQIGTIQAIFNSQRNNPLYTNPLLQITSFSKLIMGENEKHRYKANISDGQYYMKAVFSSELSGLFENNEIQRFYCLRLSAFTVRPKDNNNYLYIQSIKEIHPHSSEIGKPINVSSGSQSLEPNMKLELQDQIKEINNSDDLVKNDLDFHNTQKSPIQIKRVENITNTLKKQKLDSGFIEIKELNPFQNKWLIKGRVVSKSDIRRFSSSKGEGKLFSFEIADTSAQVKCVAFSDVVDIFYPLIELNKVYSISNGTIKMANKKFSSSNFDYEIQLERVSAVTLLEDDDIPQYMFNFVKISDLSAGPTLVDVIGIIKEVYPVSKITSKNTGKELLKRDLLLIDSSGNIRLTLWGTKAEEEYVKDTVLCLKSLKVGDYNGPAISTLASSQVIKNPDIHESVDILKWYNLEGIHLVIDKPKKTSKKQFINEIKDYELEHGTVNATVLFIKEDSLYYESCPGENCNKKVSMEDNGTYRCERCNYTYDGCKYRYMINANIGDSTGQIWITIFDEAAKIMFGISAEQLKKISEEDPQEMQNVVKSIILKEMQFRVKSKEDLYNGESRVRYSCLEVLPIETISETLKMLNIIENLTF